MMLGLLCQLFPKVTIKTIIKFNGQFELFPMQSNDSELLVKYSESEIQENIEGPIYFVLLRLYHQQYECVLVH